ncbi:DsbA family protein [Parasphingopyxis lamellibrachiae]|uniref:Protein-disulfide isomerase n=1 Tax=Parasphingopyxis lamellibrachiae TaxID=680125 RepID=A0A3D9FF84_9SPHN|nr:DsbA family protein [Parasphingopyxis lamellibrachiae]RED16222.1 protein-disulfide isomerase [Parasphingopyxis lamellibrachiae]
MTVNRWMLSGAVALIAAVAAFFLLRADGSQSVEGQTAVDLPAGLERADLEIVIREYILANPEIIPEAMERLQERRMVQMISTVRDGLETPFEGAWAGSANADVTIVEFFDYACGFCRTSLPDIERLLAEDDNLRVVYRELPILSEESVEAARVSLSAARQRQYNDFHHALFAAGRPGDATIAEAQRSAGLSPARVRSDIADPAIEAEIRNNRELAGRLELTGTPAFVVGDRILSGAVGYERLKEAVEEARRRG